MDTDRVDEMIAGWQRLRPGVALSKAGLIARARRLARLYDQAVEEALAPLGLANGGFDVLSALRRAGPPHQLTPTALVNALLLSPGAMTNRLDRLEQAGLIERRHDTEDRRVVHITLTPAGRKLADRALDAAIANAERLLQNIGKRDVARANDLLRELLLAAEGEPAGESPR